MSRIPPKFNQDDLKYLTSSKTLTLGGITSVQGPPGSGKTFLAGTASKFWPDVLPAVNVSLSDMLWLPFDSGATAGFAECGIDVPSVDVSRLMSEMGTVRGVWKALDIAVALSQGDTRPDYIVVDTVSMVDRIFLEHFNNTAPVSDKTGEKDTHTIYRETLNAHRRLHARLKGTGCKLIYLFHSKAQSDARTAEQELKQKASNVAGGGEIKIDVTGQAQTLYLAESTLQCAIVAKRKPGTKELVRKVYPFGDGTFEGKNRFARSLQYEEDPHLGKIFNKIRKVIGDTDVKAGS